MASGFPDRPLHLARQSRPERPAKSPKRGENGPISGRSGPGIDENRPRIAPEISLCGTDQKHGRHGAGKTGRLGRDPARTRCWVEIQPTRLIQRYWVATRPTRLSTWRVAGLATVSSQPLVQLRKRKRGHSIERKRGHSTFRVHFAYFRTSVTPRSSAFSGLDDAVIGRRPVAGCP